MTAEAEGFSLALGAVFSSLFLDSTDLPEVLVVTLRMTLEKVGHSTMYLTSETTSSFGPPQVCTDVIKSLF